MKILLKLFLIMVLLSALFMGSCHTEKKEPYPELKDTVAWFCDVDTNIVLMLANKYMTTIKNKQYDSLFHFVFSIKDNKLRTLSAASRKKITAHYISYPVLDYSIRDYHFNSPEDIKVTCNYIFTREMNNGFPNSMNVTLKMQRYRGKWCITLMGHD